VKLFPSIHGWHYTGKKILTEINNLPFAHVSLSRKGMLGPKGAGHPQDFDINIIVKFLFEWHLEYICFLRSFTIVSCMLLSHGSQAVQTSRFSVTRVPMNTCGMWYIERFWKCSCNFVICIVKYTHLCIKHGVQTSKWTNKLRLWSQQPNGKMSLGDALTWTQY
jgi:hypothetical protein